MDLPLTYRIETPRLLLRCWQPADTPLLFQSITASIEHLLPWIPWAKERPKEQGWTESFIRQARGQFDLGQNAIYGIFDKTSQTILGGTGLHNRIGPDAREIGYWIHVDHTGHGYTTEAVLALLKIGFEIEKLSRIEIHCAPDNGPSRRIPEKLGFRVETILPNFSTGPDGNLKDKMIWTLAVEDYKRNPPPSLELRAFDFMDREITFP